MREVVIGAPGPNVAVIGLLSQKNRLRFYSPGPNALAFQGGTLRVTNPISRTPPSNFGGLLRGADCRGAHSFDFNDWIVNGFDNSLGAGDEICAQF